MGSVPIKLAAELRKTLDLKRAVETGTYEGDGALVLSRLFPAVVTIELSEAVHAVARRRLRRRGNVECVLGDSRERLFEFVHPEVPTLFFLDGHWSSGPTAGRDNQCPLLEELATISGGHPHDCVIIDDANLLLAPPPQPYDPRQWPSFLEVVQAISDAHPEHHVTILGDQVVAVPADAGHVVHRFVSGTRRLPLRRLVRRILGGRLLPWSPFRKAFSRLRSALRVWGASRVR